METIPAVELEAQVSSVPEIRSARKIGIEIVPSVDVGYCPGHGFSQRRRLSRRDRIATLRGQLTLVRKRLQSGIPVDVSCIRRAENLARSLEVELTA